MKDAKPTDTVQLSAGDGRRKNRVNRVNFFVLAYERSKNLIVKRELMPGSEYLTHRHLSG